MKTYAPSAMKRFVVARPMPLLPPVTKAILPASFCEVVFVVFVFMVLIRGLGDGCYPNLYICSTHLPLPDTSLLLGRVLKPTVSLGVTCAVAHTYGRDDG